MPQRLPSKPDAQLVNTTHFVIIHSHSNKCSVVRMRPPASVLSFLAFSKRERFLPPKRGVISARGQEKGVGKGGTVRLGVINIPREPALLFSGTPTSSPAGPLNAP